MAKTKPTKKQLILESKRQQEEKSEGDSIVGNNKPFLAYRNKLESLTIPKKGQDLDHKHLMLVGGSVKEANVFVKDIKELGFKQSIYVECSNMSKKSLKEKIYNSMYTYFSEKDSFENLRRASTADMLNKGRDDRREGITLGNYRLCILNNISSVNNDLLCELVVTIRREKYRQYILIATVASQKEFGELPETWCDLFEIISLDGKVQEKKIEGKQPPFPTPSGAKWPDVTMYLIDLEHIKIKIKDVQEIVTYSQMGFKHKKAIKKTRLWFVLLMFAGTNPPMKCIMEKYYDEKRKVEKDIQRLNTVLRNYFGIPGNPIACKYKKESNRKYYEGEFCFFNNSHIEEHIDSKAKGRWFKYPRGYEDQAAGENPRSIVGKWKDRDF